MYVYRKWRMRLSPRSSRLFILGTFAFSVHNKIGTRNTQTHTHTPSSQNARHIRNTKAEKNVSLPMLNIKGVTREKKQKKNVEMGRENKRKK